MQGLTRQLAVDYAAQGIRFNTVSPGAIDSELNKNSAKLYPDLPPLGAPKQ
jgi:NAD(P)-dependent dehydrogenase (short-subunit alcohol dehydrogenase family)